jgi:hypothetical protein
VWKAAWKNSENHDFGSCALGFCLRRYILGGVPRTRSQMCQKSGGRSKVKALNNFENSCRTGTQVFTFVALEPAVSFISVQPFVWPWHLLQFRNIFLYTVGLPGWGIIPSQGPYLHTGQHKHRIDAHTDIHALSWIWTHDLSVRESEDSSCLKPRGHYDWQ